MASEEHLAILKQGVPAWNQWRDEHPEVIPDLSGADLSSTALIRADLSSTDLRGTHLNAANLRHAHLSGANLTNAALCRADLCHADLTSAALSRADLSGADLSRAHISGAALIRADLRSANLASAYLRRADLRSANLTSAYLSGADLSGANLTNAALSGADLSGASLTNAALRRADLSSTDLRGTHLAEADLAEAHLSNADLSEAAICFTALSNLDLSEVKGLDTVKHIGPSYIDIHAIYKSKGNIPEVFLRGAGAPDTFITFMKSLTGAAIDFYSCFISYSSQDKAFVERLYADLQAKGVRCWYAPEDLKIGEPFLLGIEQGIRLHDKLLLVLSEHSVASGWVQHEVLSALAKEQGKAPWVLFPIRVDDAIMNTGVTWATMIKQSRHIGDFTHWKDHDAYQKAFERLLRDLKAEG